MKLHHFNIALQWDGNTGNGTQDYYTYDRNFIIDANKETKILGSSDEAFRGDASRHSPEELLISALSSCHMLWYLHLCANNNITVVDYTDNAAGAMRENADGSGCFESVNLRPVVTILEGDKKELAITLHQKAQQYCFIANSVNFSVTHSVTIKIG